MDFPQYRKLSNGRSYYKILSMDEFYELQLIGSTVCEHKISTGQYPEKLRIMDMLKEKDTYLHSTEDEYNKIYHQMNS